MISIDPAEQTVRENYKLLIGTVAPRPIAFVTSIADDGTINGAPFSYFNIVSANPPMVSISVQRKGKQKKDTAHNIIHQKNFVVHLVDEENVTKINETAATLPPTESELKRAGLETISSEIIKTPAVKEARVRFECTLIQHSELGTENIVTTDFIIGKVERIHIAQNVYGEGRIRYEELNPVGRLAGSDYAKLGPVFSIQRPN